MAMKKRDGGNGGKKGSMYNYIGGLAGAVAADDAQKVREIMEKAGISPDKFNFTGYDKGDTKTVLAKLREANIDVYGEVEGLFSNISFRDIEKPDGKKIKDGNMFVTVYDPEEQESSVIRMGATSQMAQELLISASSLNHGDPVQIRFQVKPSKNPEYFDTNCWVLNTDKPVTREGNDGPFETYEPYESSARAEITETFKGKKGMDADERKFLMSKIIKNAKSELLERLKGQRDEAKAKHEADQKAEQTEQKVASTPDDGAFDDDEEMGTVPGM